MPVKPASLLMLALCLAFAWMPLRAQEGPSDVHWPSYEYPFKTQQQSMEVWRASVERYEAVNPWGYNVAYWGWPGDYTHFHAYSRYRAAKDNLALIFRTTNTTDYSGLIRVDYPFRGAYMRFPDVNPGSTSIVFSYTAPYKGRIYWYPADLIYSYDDWMTGAGMTDTVRRAWLDPRNHVYPEYGPWPWGGPSDHDTINVPDPPRLALSTATNGFRNMYAISNLNYAYMFDLIESKDILYNASDNGQVYGNWFSPVTIETLAYEDFEMPYLGTYDRIEWWNPLPEADLIPGSTPPEWWLSYTDFLNFPTSLTHWARARTDGDIEYQELASSVTNTIRNIKINPGLKNYGVVVEDFSTNIVDRRNSFQVYTVKRDPLSGAEFLSRGFQVEDDTGEHIRPVADFVLVRWQRIPQADGYLLILPSTNIPVPGARVHTFEYVDGGTSTFEVVAIPDFLSTNAEPKYFPTNYMLDSFIVFPPYSLPYTNKFNWNPMGRTDPFLTGDESIYVFDAHKFEHRYTHNQLAQYYTPPALWWLERWGYTQWSVDYNGTNYVLDTNQWWITYTRDMNLYNRLQIFEPVNLKYRMRRLEDYPTLSNIDPAINWYATVQTNYALDTNALTHLIEDRADPDTYVEFWDKDNDGTRYFKPLPTEQFTNYVPEKVADGWGWSQTPIKNVCYEDPFMEITNLALTYTNWYRVTEITASNTVAVDTNFLTITTNSTVSTGEYYFVISPVDPNYIALEIETPVSALTGWPTSEQFSAYAFPIISDANCPDGDCRSASAWYPATAPTTVSTGDCIKVTLSGGLLLYMSALYNNPDNWPLGLPDYRFGVVILSAASNGWYHYEEVDESALPLYLYYEDINYETPTYYPVDLRYLFQYTTDVVTAYDSHYTNVVAFDCNAATATFSRTYYQQVEDAYCVGDEIETVPAAETVHFYSMRWTNDAYIAQGDEGATTNYWTNNYNGQGGFVFVWTNTVFTNTYSGDIFVWRGSRWIPSAFNDLDNEGGIVQTNIAYVNATPESPDFDRWYQNPSYSNDPTYTYVTTGYAHIVAAQWQLTLSFDDEYTNNPAHDVAIPTPITPYRVTDWKTSWEYPYDPLFLKGETP